MRLIIYSTLFKFDNLFKGNNKILVSINFTIGLLYKTINHYPKSLEYYEKYLSKYISDFCESCAITEVIFY